MHEYELKWKCLLMFFRDQVFEKKDNELQKYKDQSEEYQKTVF